VLACALAVPDLRAQLQAMYYVASRRFWSNCAPVPVIRTFPNPKKWVVIVNGNHSYRKRVFFKKKEHKSTESLQATYSVG